MEQDLERFVGAVFACSPEVARAIALRAATRVYAARTVVLSQGQPCNETWLVMAGRAQAVVYGAEGQYAMLAEYAGGDLFGAITQLSETANEAEVTAVETLRAALFLAADFVTLIETHNAVGLAVSRLLLRQLRAATGRMAERVTLTAKGRVFAELLRMARPDDRGRLVIAPAPVLAVLAVRIQCVRETASRAVSELERRGVARREDGALVIVSRAMLEALIV